MNNTFSAQLYFPDPVLSPNSSKRHWSYKQDAKVFAKTYAEQKAIENFIDFGKSALQVRLVFYPPNKKIRDLDNLLAAMKPDLDGICFGLRINDNQFKRIILEWGETHKDDGGMVLVMIEEL